MQRKAVIAGGTGFLGSRLTCALREAGWRVVCLSRHEEPGVVLWDGRTPGRWMNELEAAELLVNFSGRSIACVHTPDNRQEILDSRINSTRVLAAAVARAERPPKLWLQASSLAHYGNPGEKLCSEATGPEASDVFTTEVTRAWEKALFETISPARQIAVRIGMILDAEAGGLVPLAHLTRAFLGGAAGSGRQYISWMHVADFVAACQWVCDHPPAADGGWNFCAPNPATNADFMKELRHALHRPWAPPAPALAVKVAAKEFMHTDPSLALTGCRAEPRALVDAGFKFRFPKLDGALADIASRMKGR
ncbi:MAG TPA: TIGR01777 family oxidoreductase [Opitutaceae bacterium]|jgi:hypothetical protein